MRFRIDVSWAENGTRYSDSFEHSGAEGESLQGAVRSFMNATFTGPTRTEARIEFLTLFDESLHALMTADSVLPVEVPA